MMATFIAWVQRNYNFSSVS